MTLSVFRSGFMACVVAASAFLLVSCTSDKDTAGSSSSSTATTEAPSVPAPTALEEKLTEQVEAAVESVHEGTMVESGVERVSEGIHTEPVLGKGATYRLNLACAGKGSAQLLFTPASAG
ncbi:hypothetical protein ACWDD4_42980, partial [Streptomyces sp. NPDC001205]